MAMAQTLAYMFQLRRFRAGFIESAPHCQFPVPEDFEATDVRGEDFYNPTHIALALNLQ